MKEDPILDKNSEIQTSASKLCADLERAELEKLRALVPDLDKLDTALLDGMKRSPALAWMFQKGET